MSNTSQNEANILLWTLAKLFATFEQCQYLFATQCIWWIAALFQLDTALRYFLKYLKFPSEEPNMTEWQIPILAVIERGISQTPRDIRQRSAAIKYNESVDENHQADSSRRTRKGTINPLPKHRTNLSMKGIGLPNWKGIRIFKET